MTGSVQGQAGWGFEQPAVVQGVPAHGRGVGTSWSIRSLPTQTILWFNDFRCAHLWPSWWSILSVTLLWLSCTDMSQKQIKSVYFLSLLKSWSGECVQVSFSIFWKWQVLGFVYIPPSFCVNKSFRTSDYLYSSFLGRIRYQRSLHVNSCFKLFAFFSILRLVSNIRFKYFVTFYSFIFC